MSSRLELNDDWRSKFVLFQLNLKVVAGKVCAADAAD
jgi:hypothetical protein